MLIADRQFRRPLSRSLFSQCVLCAVIESFNRILFYFSGFQCNHSAALFCIWMAIKVNFHWFVEHKCMSLSGIFDGSFTVACIWNWNITTTLLTASCVIVLLSLFLFLSCKWPFSADFVVLAVWLVLIDFLFHFLPLFSSFRLAVSWLLQQPCSSQRVSLGVSACIEQKFKLSRRSNVGSAAPQTLCIYFYILFT